MDYFVNPFVGGVYAGDPSRLSVVHAFPKLHQLEQRYRSLVAGTVLGARERAKSAVKSKLNARMFTFDTGMQVLVEALYEAVKDSVDLGRSVVEVERSPDGWRLEFLHGPAREHAAILLCAPAHKLAQVCVNGKPDLRFLKTIPYPPIARITLGFKRERVRHPLNGFGALVPAKEGLSSLGIFFSSSLFPGRAPHGHVAMTVFLGGSRNPELCGAGEDAVLHAALSDVRCLLRAEGDPVFQDMAIIPRSIPQYEVGFGTMREGMEHLEQSWPGLFLAGSYRGGISVGDSMVSGLVSAEKIREYLRNGATGNSAHQHRVA